MIPRFYLAGFPVQIHPLFLLTTLALGARWMREPAKLGVWFGVVLASVLLHELGHALAFRRYGCPASISLHGLGGTTTAESAERLKHRQHLWVSLAGPGAGFALGGLVLALRDLTPVGQAGGLVGFTVGTLLWTNIGWGLFNLLPVLPLDGGHALAAAIRARAGYRYEWLIHLISVVVAACGLVLAVLWKQLWLGMFALILGGLNAAQLWRAWEERRYMIQLRSPPPPPRRPGLSGDEASASVEQLLAELRLPSRYTPSSERGPDPPRPAPASPRLTGLAEPEPSEAPMDPRFVGEWLLDNGLAPLALRPLRAAFCEEPSARTAHALVDALVEAGHFEELARLLTSPSAAHFADPTLALIATRAEAAGQSALASRAHELSRTLGRPEALPAPRTHDSEKPG